MVFINRLKELRSKYNINQDVISKLLNVKQPTISDYENENLDMPTDVLVKLADYYKTSTDYILCLTDDETPHKLILRKNKNRFKELRISNKYTGKKVSTDLYLVQASYSRYENGIHDIPITILIKIANYYNTSVDYLLYRTDDLNKYSKRKNKETD